jgi:HK97 family phage prohead protease
MPSDLSTQFKTVRYTVTAGVTSEAGEASITISTKSPDRSRDCVMPEGCVLTNYLKNPVVTFGHDYSAIPVGTCTSVESSSEGVSAKWRWLKDDPFADRVRNAWDQGVLRAASIGFLPLKWAYDEERRGFDFTEWDMLEFSIVAVPCNPEAVRTLRAFGLPIEREPLNLDALETQVSDLAAAVRTLTAALPVGGQVATTADIAVSQTAPSETLALTLVDDDELYLELADPLPNTFDIDPTVLREALAGVLTSALRGLAGDAATAAVRRASGRVD